MAEENDDTQNQTDENQVPQSPQEVDEQTPVDSIPAAETPTEEIPVAETPTEESPAEESPAEESPAEQSPGEDAPADVTPADETPADETPAIAEPEPEPITAVSLGLIAADFVSRPSTELHFYAPTIAPLPALPEPENDDDDEQSGSNRSARRRRRRGGSSDGEQDGSGRRKQRAVEVITEPQRIKGSTRLEAKKQRRRDGREAGRRRPVVTEAEFLARREAVDRQMVVRSKDGIVQIGVLEDDVLVEHYVARNQDASLIGNVYLGRVQNVLPSMEAAFVDIGRGRNAVLYSGEVDWDGVETGNQPRRIELALKQGDKVLVQVTKDPVGHKGARLTSQISLPGRYLVYVPGGAMNGISRKLPDTERARLKNILKEVVPASSGVIVRTAAEGATEDQLTRDVTRLRNQWEHISALVEKGQAPALLHSEPDLLVKIVRDVFNEDFTKLVIQGSDAQRTITEYLTSVAPDLLDRVTSWEGERDPFDELRITEQIEKALDRKVWLPSGGSLVIDRTEAMTVIDVNTGKFVGTGGNLEETVTKNNLEAAEEIVRQLRLRDSGGIIVVDFIDMVLESNRDLVLRRLVECLSRDRTKHQVAEVTSLGLVQMTRKKIGLGLLETFSEACEVCAGRGVVVQHDPVFKHRSSSGGGSPRRSRGGSHQQQAPAGSTHVITEGAKSALAQIAASTIPKSAENEEEAPIAIDLLTLDEGETPTLDIELPGDPRGGQDAPSVPGPASAPESASSVPEPSSVLGPSSVPEPVEGRPKRPRRRRPVEKPKSVAPESEAAHLLDSVLDALPEPKAPGQGRGRRRVTTAAITGTAAPVNPED
ncbi:MAG: Rne/Rng family ribonuclease [Microbacterium sp.]